MSGCVEFPAADSMKKCLQFLGWLNNGNNLHPSTLREQTIRQFKERVQSYCNQTYLRKLEDDSNGYFAKTLIYAEKLLDNIIRHSDNKYGDYQKCDRAKVYSDEIITSLPQYFSTFYFFYYRVSSDCDSIEGGGWQRYTLKETGNNLYKWLIDDPSMIMAHLTQRGYVTGDNFTESTGLSLGLELKHLVKYDTPSNIQNLLCSMIFFVKWTDSTVAYALTGHACLFLHKFCMEVKKDVSALKPQINGRQLDKANLQHVCEHVMISLDRFVGFAATSGICAVCQQNTNVYNDLWDYSKFEEYAEWIKNNNIIYIMKTSLEQMKTECVRWETNNLSRGTSAGPFKFGFVFTNGWNGTFADIQATLGLAISKLTAVHELGSLDTLLLALNTFESGSASSPAAAVTSGVLGTGAIGLGAAYAFNLGGFADTVRSLIRIASNLRG